MAKFRNVSPLGALDIPALGQIVEAGAVFEVADDMTSYFADQSANFEPVVKQPSRPKAKKKDAPDASRAPGEAPGETDTEEKEGDR